MTDVIVTITAGGESARRNALAVLRGGGLVGVDSTVTPPEGVEIDFLDWPFLKASATVEDHIAAAREFQPKYAVAPDVMDDRTLDDALATADDLAHHAENVIVVPKSVPVEAVPDRFIAGAPFRDEFETDTGVNTYIDFHQRPTHILGGNHTDQIKLAERFDLTVTSADSPNVLSWAQGGRVWIAQLGGANDVDDLPENFIEDEAAFTEGFPTQDELAAPDDASDDAKRVAAAKRIEFSVRNLVRVWNDTQRALTIPEAVEPGRGPPPVPPEGSGLLGPAETFEEREAMRERFQGAEIESEAGRVETERALALFAQEAEGGGNADAMPPTAQELADRPQQYRLYQPQEFIDAVGVTPGNDAEVDRKLRDALNTVESARFAPFLEATSSMFSRLDRDEQELFTRRNPVLVQWMSAYNTISDFNPYTEWFDLAATLLEEQPLTSRVGMADRSATVMKDAVRVPPFERRDAEGGSLLEDMAFRRRSYRGWSPFEFIEIVEQDHELSRGLAADLNIYTPEIREQIAEDGGGWPITETGDVVARALFQRVEAGRFEPMLSTGHKFFIPLDPDEAEEWTKQNPGITTWFSAWGASEHQIHGEQLMQRTSVEWPPLGEVNNG